MAAAITGKWGFRVLAIWLIVTGLAGIINLSFNGFSLLMAVLAMVAGILILVDR